jgi:hypothetical protein
MLTRVLLVVVLVGALVSLTPLAYADPLDPVWIPGIWDDDDQDNAVTLATSGVHGVTASWVDVGQPSLIVVARVLPQDPRAVVGTDLGLVQSRAPPSI